MKITRHPRRDGAVSLKKGKEFIGTIPAPLPIPTASASNLNMMISSPEESPHPSGETDKALSRWQKIKNLRGIDPNCEMCRGSGEIIKQVDGSLGHHPCPKCNPNGTYERIEPERFVAPSSWGEPDTPEPSKEEQIQGIREKHFNQNHDNSKIAIAVGCRCEEEIKRIESRS